MQSLAAHSWAEAHLYLKVTPCEECSRGPWEIQAEPEEAGGRTLRAKCINCGAVKEFAFQCPPAPAETPTAGEQGPGEDLPAERINPTPSPSSIIDAGQWLSLFYLLVETASKIPDRGQARRITFQAALCLDEALKFYSDDDELPPQTALFTEASRQAFASYPERFARQRLRDLRSKLPELRVMAGRLARDAQRATPKRWWQFWRR